MRAKGPDKLPISDRWITVGGAHHYRVVPRMPDMSWLGAPPSEHMSARYEAQRQMVIERTRAESQRRLVELARAVQAVDLHDQREIVEMPS